MVSVHFDSRLYSERTSERKGRLRYEHHSFIFGRDCVRTLCRIAPTRYLTGQQDESDAVAPQDFDAARLC